MEKGIWEDAERFKKRKGIMERYYNIIFPILSPLFLVLEASYKLFSRRYRNPESIYTSGLSLFQFVSYISSGIDNKSR